ncbi:MAG: septum formation initiator family protein [Methylococcales bacterium]
MGCREEAQHNEVANAWLCFSTKNSAIVEGKTIKTYIILVTLLIVHLQYRIWSGDGSLEQIEKYNRDIENLKIQIQAKKERNDGLYAELYDLRKGQDAIEERARYELGMIQPNETFFQILE